MKNLGISEHHLYNKAYTRGKKFVGKLIAVYILRDFCAKKIMLANPEKKYLNRVGISVSKKIGCAVVRSRTKRILRAAYRNIECEGNLRTGQLVVIAPRSAAKDKKSTDIERELRYAFLKLDMFIPKNAEE